MPKRGLCCHTQVCTCFKLLAVLVFLSKTMHVFMSLQHSQKVKTPQKSQSVCDLVSCGKTTSTWDAGNLGYLQNAKVQRTSSQS